MAMAEVQAASRLKGPGVAGTGLEGSGTGLEGSGTGLEGSSSDRGSTSTGVRACIYLPG